jgi:hypothetical protein
MEFPDDGRLLWDVPPLKDDPDDQFHIKVSTSTADPAKLIDSRAAAYRW